MISQEKIWDKEYSKKENLWKKEVENLPRIFKNKNILELGVGNGKTLISLLKQKPKKITAIDFSINAIKNTDKKFSKEKNLEFLKADARNLPFQENSFDIVIARYILNNLLEKDREIAIKEIFKVLKSKGVVFFEDFALGDFRSLEIKKTLEKNTLQKKEGMICHFFEEEELNNLFKDFSKNKIKKLTYNPFKNKGEIKRVIFSGILTK